MFKLLKLLEGLAALISGMLTKLSSLCCRLHLHLFTGKKRFSLAGSATFQLCQTRRKRVMSKKVSFVV